MGIVFDGFCIVRGLDGVGPGLEGRQVNPFDLQRLSCDFTVYYIRSVGRVRMFIAITLKRYRAVKEVGKIKMSVGIIAYYQLMQVCQAEYFRQLLKPVT
ncbi:hypothetical protein ACSBR2_014360 [Camellia fascicularis]